MRLKDAGAARIELYFFWWYSRRIPKNKTIHDCPFLRTDTDGMKSKPWCEKPFFYWLHSQNDFLQNAL